MELQEKINYAIELLDGVWLSEESLIDARSEMDEKTELEIDDFIIKLEEYYHKQNALNTGLLNNINKMGLQIDEAMDSAIEKQTIENFNF